MVYLLYKDLIILLADGCLCSNVGGLGSIPGLVTYQVLELDMRKNENDWSRRVDRVGRVKLNHKI